MQMSANGALNLFIPTAHTRSACPPSLSSPSQQHPAPGLRCHCRTQWTPQRATRIYSAINWKSERPAHVPCARSRQMIVRASGSTSQAETPSLTEAVADLDRELDIKESNEEAAVKRAEGLRDLGLLRGFGKARQIPKRSYTLEELRLNKIESEQLLSPTDDTLSGVRSKLQWGGLAGLTALFYGAHLQIEQMLAVVLGVLFIFTADQIANGGGLEAMALDTAGRVINRSYGERVALHESGHFLIAYLLGWLPRAYTLSSLDAFRTYNTLNVQAGTQLCDGAFQREVATGKLSSASLDDYSCIALAGVATEYLRYGRAEGGNNDVAQLDAMLKGLQFSQMKANDEIRWAVLNVVSLLRRHSTVHDKLADAMGRGLSVGACIAVIEEELVACDDV